MMQLLRAAGAHGEILTLREFSVLQLLMEGQVTKQIAEALESSESTVGTHRQRIMEKSGCHEAASLARWACRNGLDG